MKKLREKWNNVARTNKLWALGFFQIWMWPQLFSPSMATNIAIPLFVTMVVCLIFNVIRLVNAYDAGEY